jgi:hypothetical protein
MSTSASRHFGRVFGPGIVASCVGVGFVALVVACSSNDADTSGSSSGAGTSGASGGTSGGTSGATSSGASGATSSGGASGNSATSSGTLVDPPPYPPLGEGPAAGNPDGRCQIPQEANPVDVSRPRTVVGNGTKSSCDEAAFLGAVAKGGIITFSCGPEPVTITLSRPAKIVNDTGPEIVIDGGGKVTLSGGGKTRILYMNTCDQAQKWTTATCQNQDHPRLTVQNLTFIDGNSKNEAEYDGGGAIWARGGRLKIINSRFFRNVCAEAGPDVGGAAVRAFDQYQGQPVYIANSTFGGGAGFGNTCANGGGISSIGVSWSIFNTLFSHNRAIGRGGNPAPGGTPGGGSGGAIYNDGNKMTLSLCGVAIRDNEVVQHGSAIFFVSNNHTGNISIDRSNITANKGGSWYTQYPQISAHDDTPIAVKDSVIR